MERRQFSEEVMNLRRKVKIIDLNIQKCQGLVERLDQTSLGILTKNLPFLQDTVSAKKTSAPPQGRQNRVVSDQSDEIQTSFTTVLVDLLEEKIMKDLEKKLVKNLFSAEDAVDTRRPLQKKLSLDHNHVSQTTDRQEFDEAMKRLQAEFSKKRKEYLK
jgi:hypothetical protein